MKTLWRKRFVAAVVATLLFLGAASGLSVAKAATTEGGIAPLTAGLDTILTEWVREPGMVRFSASMRLDALLPFTKERVDMMNALLQHASLQAALEQDGSGSLTSIQLSVQDSPLFSLAERQQGSAYTLETSLLPQRALHATGASPISQLGGMEAEGGAASGANETEMGEKTEEGGAAPEAPFDMLMAIQEAEGSYKALIAACEPYAEKKKANYKIKSIGTSKWSEIARLTPEQSDEMLPQLRAVLGAGMDSAHRAELEGIRFGKGFIVGLYKESEAGKDMAVYIKGDILYPDGSTAKLSYQWAFVNNGLDRKDDYKYELVRATKPSTSRIIGGYITQKNMSDTLSVKGSYDAAIKEGKVTTTDTFTVDLAGKESGGARTLEGNCALQTKVTEDGKSNTTATSLAPALLLTTGPSGDVWLSGKATIEHKQNKTVLSGMTVTFAKDVPATIASLGQSSLYSVSEEPSVTLSGGDTFGTDVSSGVVPDADATGGTGSAGGASSTDAPATGIIITTGEDALPPSSGMDANGEPPADGGAKSIGHTGNTTDNGTGSVSSVDGSQPAAGDAADYLVGRAPIGLKAYTTPSQIQDISLDTITPSAYEALMGELSQNLAGRLLTAFASLPQEDTALLRDGMSEEDYAAFEALLSGL